MPKATRRDIDAARRLVRERDGDRCTMCGINLTGQRASVHHRTPKGMGGSALLESPANLVTLCGSGNADGCHGKAHSNPQWARNHGWLVSRSFDPAEIPVDMHDGWWLLANDGKRVPYILTAVECRWCHKPVTPSLTPPDGEANSFWETADQSKCVYGYMHDGGAA